MVRWRVFELVEHLPDGDARNRIEPGGRLIEKKDARIVHQPAGNFEPAAHSAGERLGLRIAPLGQVDGFQHVVDVLFSLGPGYAVELGVDAQVLFDRQILVAGHRLRNDADHAAHLIRILGHIVAADDRLARGHGNQRGHHADERALAGAVGPEQAEDLAFGDAEVHVLDGFKSAVALHRCAPPQWPRARGESVCTRLD